MAAHPYTDLPAYRLWRRAVAAPAAGDVDPVLSAKFRIAPADRVATAGSCFAQHIARHLRSAGFTYFVTEAANPVVPPDLAEKFNYGVFTARYGNLYTARQLRQTLTRAYGRFHPAEDVWQRADGRLIDPFRPQIQPDGFVSVHEFHAQRAVHYAAIRRAVEEMDVFVFTLGLTEAWYSRVDGAVFPVCPGVSGGEFDPARHGFANFTVTEVVADMRAAIGMIRQRNPRCRVILTVSPVPLIATAMDRSVLVSTTYSKSVLRVAAEELAQQDPLTAYFPSYEVITGPHSRGAYYAEDLRSVTEAGVSHVMRLFLRHYADTATAPPAPAVGSAQQEAARLARIDAAVAVVCEEEALDRGTA